MATIYSKRLAVFEYSFNTGATMVFYTSPPGFVTVLRELDMSWNRIPLNGEMIIDAFSPGLDFVPVWSASTLPRNAGEDQWTGRLVLEVGDQLRVTSGLGAGLVFRCWASGYLLKAP